MSNVWGTGGLFEQALASKMALQGAQGSALEQNAATNLLQANNQYDLGLRRDQVDQGNLGVNRGQLDLNRSIANSTASNDRFKADTERLIGFNQYGKTAPDSALIGSLGLRTVNPYSSSSATPAKPASPMLSSSTGNSTKPNFFGDKPFGMRDGGMIMKPKMVKQPGYMHGGKVTMPKGYRDGGTIGDVKKDTGRDTVDVKARQGEYFLNPETVAQGFGEGDYAAGVRNLNQIVRQATGKEPGPSPVGKSGKQGFNLSGATVNPADLRPEFRNVVGETVIQAPPQRGVNPNVGPGRASAEAKAFQAAQTAAAEAPKSPGMAARAAQSVNQVLDMNAGDALRKGAKAVGSAVGAAKDAAVAAARSPLVGVAGKIAVPVGLAAQARDTYNTPTEEYYQRTGIDPTATHVPQIMKDMGVRTLGTLQDIGNTATFGLADRFGNLTAGNGFTRSAQYQDAPAAPAAAPAANSQAGAGRGFVNPEPVTPGAETAAKEPSLRDMMMERYRGLNEGLRGADAMKTITSLNQMAGLQKDLVDMEEKQISAKAAAPKLQMDQRNKNSDDLEKMIKERFTKKFVDDKGEVKESFDQASANEFRRHIIDRATKAGLDVRDMSPYDVMSSAADFQTRQGVRNTLNQELSGMRDGRVSSEMLNPREIVKQDELRLTDVMPFSGGESSARFLRDYVPSLVKGGDYDKVVVVKRGGKEHRVPMTQFTRMADGSVNEDVLNQYPSLRSK